MKCFLTVAAVVVLGLPLWAEEAAHPGAVIYEKQCAECHGKTGEGVPGEFEGPLRGDRSIKSLTKLITKTMPEEAPEACVGADAEMVADFVYNAFYSPEASEKLGRGANARIELTRMTVGQYRNSVADLLGQFDPKTHSLPNDDGQRGLTAEYFSSEGMNKKHQHKLKRVDGRIDFDFGEASPGEGMPSDQFSIVWEGSFFAPDDGMYEFKVSTPNGVRLYVNADLKPGNYNYRDDSSESSGDPLIDAWVSSGGNLHVETGKVYLLGGRTYPLRLDYFKYKEKTGSVKLEWKSPHGAWDVLCGDDVRPVVLPRVFVVGTPFPADDASLGYERGSSVSRQWFDAVTKGGLEIATEVLARNFAQSQDGNKAREFCKRFIEAAFRRPVAERDAMVEGFFKDNADAESAVKRCVLYAMTSPQFLYPGASAKDDAYEVATRLSMALWDSIPDRTLMEAARKDELQNPEQIKWHAQRMIADPRTKAKLRGFFEHWLEMDARELAKDSKLYPTFDEATISSLRKSLHLFLDEVVWGPASDYRQLLTADYLLLDDRTQALYGGEKVGDGPAGFARVKSSPEHRSGVLTHPYLLSVFAYHNNTSPIHRGVFLTRNIVGRMLKPPPKAVAFKDDEFDPNLTMREKVTQLTKDSACMSCHSVINPLGFSLENFDAVGRWQEMDKQKPVNTQSEYTTLEGETITLKNARDIGAFAASSEDGQRSFVAALFHHSVKQAIDAYGAATLPKLREQFEIGAFSIQNLLTQIAIVAARPPQTNTL